MGEGAASDLSSCRPYPAGSPSLCCGERRPRGEPRGPAGVLSAARLPLAYSPLLGQQPCHKAQHRLWWTPRQVVAGQVAPSLPPPAGRQALGPSRAALPPLPAGLWQLSWLPRAHAEVRARAEVGAELSRGAGEGQPLWTACSSAERAERGWEPHGGSLGSWGQPLTSLLASVGQGRWLGAGKSLSHHPRGLLLRLWVVGGDCRGSGSPHTRACHPPPPGTPDRTVGGEGWLG